MTLIEKSPKHIVMWEESFLPGEHTLFYIKNDWDIKDYSQYNHTMNWNWTEKYVTLSNGKKMLNIDWTNWTYSNQFFEANNKTTFTLHIWWKWISDYDTNPFVWWWVWRSKWDGSTNHRWFSFLESYSYKEMSVLYWNNTSSTSWWTQPSRFSAWLPSSIKLWTATINWNQFKIYVNWSQTDSWTWDTIKWWSDIWPIFCMWPLLFYDWSSWAWAPVCNIWETILEDTCWSVDEILAYYNNKKSEYLIS